MTNQRSRRMSRKFRTFRAVAVAGHACCQKCGGRRSAARQPRPSVAPVTEPPLNLQEFGATVAEGFKIMGWVKQSAPAAPDLAQAIARHRHAHANASTGSKQPPHERELAA